MKSENKVCSTCRHFRKFERPFQREDGAVIYGYCFKDAKSNYSPNMGKGYQYLSRLTYLSRFDIEMGCCNIICHDHEYLGVISGDTIYRITKRTRLLEKRPSEDQRLTGWFDRYADCLAEAKYLLSSEV